MLDLLSTVLVHTDEIFELVYFNNIKALTWESDSGKLKYVFNWKFMDLTERQYAYVKK